MYVDNGNNMVVNIQCFQLSLTCVHPI